MSAPLKCQTREFFSMPRRIQKVQREPLEPCWPPCTSMIIIEGPRPFHSTGVLSENHTTPRLPPLLLLSFPLPLMLLVLLLMLLLLRFRYLSKTSSIISLHTHGWRCRDCWLCRCTDTCPLNPKISSSQPNPATQTPKTPQSHSLRG